MQDFPIIPALSLLTLANGTPVIVKKLLGSHLACPLDAGTHFADGQPLFGTSKTIRGVVGSIAVTAAVAPVFGLNISLGALVAAFAMIGDLLSSFTKRRLRFPPSTRAIGLDQIPESLLPLLLCQRQLSLTFPEIAITVGIFLVGELVLSRILYRLHVRDQPY
jgi:CDP-2,3-bis-(O-geranylgeranyl)-sn-glycerol synthase